jgi:hypothetical protein
MRLPRGSSGLGGFARIRSAEIRENRLIRVEVLKRSRASTKLRTVAVHVVDRIRMAPTDLTGRDAQRFGDSLALLRTCRPLARDQMSNYRRVHQSPLRKLFNRETTLFNPLLDGLGCHAKYLFQSHVRVERVLELEHNQSSGKRGREPFPAELLS